MSAVIDEPALFKGANQALKFAFGESAVYGPSAIAQLMGRVRSGNGHGLVGIDRSSQAGMILDIVGRQIDPLHWWILVCRCAPRYKTCECGARCCAGKVKNMQWEEGIAQLVLGSLAEFSGMVTARGLREQLIKAHFGVHVDPQASIAKKYDVNRDTVASYGLKIRQWLYGDQPTKKNARKGEEARAWASAEEILLEAGII